jgi:hypothetical protein
MLLGNLEECVQDNFHCSGKDNAYSLSHVILSIYVAFCIFTICEPSKSKDENEHPRKLIFTKYLFSMQHNIF